MRSRILTVTGALFFWLAWAGAAAAQQGGGPFSGFKKMFDMQIILVIVGVIIVAIMLIWGFFKFVMGAAFLRGKDNKDRDLGGWKPPTGR